jgi:hypothetical protein
MPNTTSPDGLSLSADAASDGDLARQIYEAIRGACDPMPPDAIADGVGCDPAAARRHADWFTALGIVTRRGGDPATYEWDDERFEGRESSERAATHSLEELRERVGELTARIAAYEATYGAATPDDVDAPAAAAASDDRSIGDVYRALADWATAREERERDERAREQRARVERSARPEAGRR